MIAIVDTGGANISSIQNALLRLGAESVVTSDRQILSNSDHWILPGVGHAKYAMEKLRDDKLVEFIAQTQKPVLGICLGMQLLFTNLEEGDVNGLSVLPGTVSALVPTANFRVPNMGWCPLKLARESQLLRNIDLHGDTAASFYFVHSYQAPKNAYVCAVTATAEQIPAVIEYKNFFATQFHPEKSGPMGSQILKNFLECKDLVSTNQQARK